jgi:hypothetical protein
MAMRRRLPSYVFQALKILLNSNRSLKEGSDLRSQLQDMLEFVKQHSQWLSSASHIEGRVWEGRPTEPFFPDLILPMIRKFFSSTSYSGALEPSRIYLNEIFCPKFICNLHINTLLKEFPGLDSDYKFGPNINERFDYFFANLLGFRAYGFHVKELWATDEEKSRKNEQWITKTFTRKDAYIPTWNDLYQVLLADYYGIDTGDWSNYSGSDPWTLILRPIWQFRNTWNDFVEDKTKSNGIDHARIIDGSLAALLVTDSVTFTWPRLKEFIARLPNGDQESLFFPARNVNSLLFTAWENADFVARIHPEFGTATQPDSFGPFQSSFSVFFEIPRGPAQVQIHPENPSFAAAIEAFCKAMIIEDNHLVHLFERARNADYPSSECFLLGELRYISILDQIRTEIVSRFDHILSPFADWLFHAGCPLLVRQVIAVLRALESLLPHRESFQNGHPLPNDVSKRFAVLSREVAVFSLLLNP